MGLHEAIQCEEVITHELCDQPPAHELEMEMEMEMDLMEMEMKVMMMQPSSGLSSSHYDCNIISSVSLAAYGPAADQDGKSIIINQISPAAPTDSLIPMSSSNGSNFIYTSTLVKYSSNYATICSSSMTKTQRLIFQHYEARSQKVKLQQRNHPHIGVGHNYTKLVPCSNTHNNNNKPSNLHPHHAPCDDDDESDGAHDLHDHGQLLINLNIPNSNEYEVISPILNLKNLHGWITWWLIHLFTQGGEAVLDLACGKGGDLHKWSMARASAYVGVDMVSGLLDVARLQHESSGYAFKARFVCADAFTPSLLDALLVGVPAAPGKDRGHEAIVPSGSADPKSTAGLFDVCSCQFALHYAWSSEKRARAAIANVAALLKPGGYFIGTIPDAAAIVGKLCAADAALGQNLRGGADGCPHRHDTSFGNSLYRITFTEENRRRALLLDPRNSDTSSDTGAQIKEATPSPTNPTTSALDFGIQYEFFLADAVHYCPEWLVPLHSLIGLAKEHGLVLVSASNFHEFLREHESHHEYQLHHHKHPHEWDCASTYLAFAFQKDNV